MTYDVRRVPLQVDNLPAVLRERPNWVAWRVKPAAEKDKKPGKVPVTPRTGEDAKSNDPTTWGTFEAALERATKDRLGGIGFMFGGSGYVGVDLDHCRNPDTGVIEPWALDIIRELDTYSEASVTGTGVHCIALGLLPEQGRKRGNVEMYQSGRFFCFTGALLQDTPNEIRERTPQLTKVHATWISAKSRVAPPKPAQQTKARGVNLQARARRYVDGCSNVSEGSRNDNAFQIAGHLRSLTDGAGGRLTESEIYDLTAAWNARNSPPLPDDELRSCVRNGISKGTPRADKPPRQAAESAESLGLVDLHTTDIGNAERLVRVHGDDLRHCRGWLVWDLQRWRVDDTGESERRAKDMLRRFQSEVDALPDSTEDEQEYKDSLAKFARQSENDSRVRALLERARVELPIACRLDDFDSDGWLLNVQNGTLDLRTGKLLPHSREHRITKLAPVWYDPAATHPDIEHFLNSATLGDVEFRSYIERAIGYTLATENRSDAVFILAGPSRTGKTTLIETIRAMLGDYGATVAFTALLERERGGAPRPELVDTRGARIAIASEAPEEGRFDAAALKSFVGGDTINVRRLYENPVQFRATATLWLACNQIPKIKDESATRARLRILPFERVHEPDPDRLDELPLRERLRDPKALAALLAVAVRGCVAWQHDGLGTCSAVERATAAYWGDAPPSPGVVQQFVERECVLGPDVSVTTGELYERFMETQGASRLSITAFGSALGLLGYTKRKSHGTVLRVGLRLGGTVGDTRGQKENS